MANRLTLIGIAVLYLVLTAEVALPESWAGFYQSQTVVPRGQTAQADNVCLNEILAAQSKYEIPDNLLLAIGIQEAGRQVGGQLMIWPWTANVHGRGAFFDSKDALEKWVRETQSDGQRSIDVGCMQVNLRWHAHEFPSLKKAINPAMNVDYAARFLTALYRDTGNWQEAAGRYHSSTPNLKKIYLERLVQNQKLANSGIMAEGAQTGIETVARAQPSFNWSADMTGTGAQTMRRVVSIYSPTPLQPLLPNYERQR